MQIKYFSGNWIVVAFVLAMCRCHSEVHAATLIGCTLCTVSLPNCTCGQAKTMTVHCQGSSRTTGTKFQAVGNCTSDGDCSPVFYQNGDFNFDFTKSYEVPAGKKLSVTVAAKAENCPTEDVCPDGTCHEVYCPFTGTFDTTTVLDC
ncbi:MAG: hypothetical protein COY42_02075 [Armatimonadetes bacterium CG_4_10_14_0_8_um_filter_66_14]|nr:hypothetical protein [Armatimonadota bacterium]NDK16839.1 hypothetical protein [Armatimonadota bacterium]PIZ50204.1 MAG: hypothetical protein COY42_02075 [Armatimonadetes bacterium CG_4_10_14_0_8_um_filter_66_14]PJB67189.1 MAG: hypothetical protein CO096_16270 [Armatimonadetes bacterium CG_4_9_14_3_um_filter_66_14]